MPKKLKIHPNERVDLVDFNRAANEYTIETSKFGKERVVLDRRSRILEGFRVEIANQTTNPGQFTVFNGNALDRTGRQLNDEDQVNDARTFTLTGANLSFYVEIEYTESDSDSDSRSFWDPTYDNGGAPTPDGREFNLNVSTRTTPTWRIHTPITSGPVGGTPLFDEITNPNSTRIPVAVLSTNGANEITGVTQVNAASVIESDILAGVTSLRVLNSRLFPAAGTASLGFGSASVEAVTITGNDRTNGILTLAAPTANAHPAGAIVRETGVTARFMQEQTDPTTSVAHSDAQSRLWQGNELRGAAVQSSKEVYLGRDDLNARSLKDYVDFVAAQVRELKFGSAVPSVVSAAPPSAFAAAPRYFDRVGSVAGARNATVSIGDGTSSFGDFNGTDEVPFIAAIAALPATGGSIHVKAGTYTFANQLSIATKPFVLFGDGSANTRIINTVGAGTPMVLVTGLTVNQHARLENISLETSGASTLLYRQDGGRCFLTSSVFLGQVDFSTSAVERRIVAMDCLFQNSASGGIAVSTASQIGGVFQNCAFRVGTTAGTEVCFSGSGDGLVFSGCHFSDDSGVPSFAPVAVNVIAAVGTNEMSIVGCQIQANKVFDSTAATLGTCLFSSCVIGASGTPSIPTFEFGPVLGLRAENLYLETAWSGAGASAAAVFKFSSNDVSNCVFDGIEANQGTAGQLVNCWEFNNVNNKKGVVISGGVVTGFHRGVYAVGGTGNLTIRDLTVDGNGSTIDQYGVVLEDEAQENVEISGVNILGFGGVSTTKVGIWVQNTVAVDNLQIKIHDCVIRDLNDVGGSFGYGILLQESLAPSATAYDRYIDIQNNVIQDIQGDTISRGISLGPRYNPAGQTGSSTIVSGNVLNRIIAASQGGGIFWLSDVNAEQAVITNNNLSEIISTGAGAADAMAGIYIGGGQGHIISNNVFDEIGNTAGGTASGSCAILCAGGPAWAASGTRISGNKIKLDPRGLSYWTDSAIKVDQSGAITIRGFEISHNLIEMGVNTLNGIYFRNGTGSTLSGLSVVHNQVTNLALANGQGVYVSLAQGAKNINVSNNLVEESVFEVGHTGISVVANGVPVTNPSAVVVSGNTVTGDLSGAGLRTGFGLYLYYINQFSVTGNSLAWVGGAPATVTGTSIAIDGASRSGVVSSNVVNVSGGVADIDLAAVFIIYPGPAIGTSACIAVRGNVGFSTVGNGAIAPAASPYASWVVGGNANF